VPPGGEEQLAVEIGEQCRLIGLQSLMFERGDDAVAVLVQHHQVDDPDRTGVDESLERLHDAWAELGPGKTDLDPLNRPGRHGHHSRKNSAAGGSATRF
jgi:hypothetical protein